MPYSGPRSEFVFHPHTQGIREALPASVFCFVPTFRPHPLFCYADRSIMIVPKCSSHRSFQDVADSIHAEIRRKHTIFSERKYNPLQHGCSPAQFDALARGVPRSFFHPIRVLPGCSCPHSTRAVLAPLAPLSPHLSPRVFQRSRTLGDHRTLGRQPTPGYCRSLRD